MTATLLADIDGEHVPLSKCDWVLLRPCGCPAGVTMAAYAQTEEAAWKSLYDYKREIIAAHRRGMRLELVKHQRWSDELLALHLSGCAKCGAPVQLALTDGGES